LGSSVQQFDDILSGINGNQNLSGLSRVIDQNLAAFMIGSENAIDFTKAAGGMKIRGIGDVAQSNIIAKGLADAASMYGTSMTASQMATIIQNLGVQNLNDAGIENITNLGRRIGFFRTAGAMFDAEDMSKFGVDMALIQRSLTGKKAQEALIQGIMSGSDIAVNKINFASADQKALGEAMRSNFEGMSDAEVMKAIALPANSKYAALTVQTTFGQAIRGTFGNISKREIMLRRSSEIDAFYYRREQSVLPTSITEVAERIVEDFKADFDSIENFAKTQRQDLGELTQQAEARQSLAKIKLAQKYKEEIQNSVQELQRMGFSNIEDLDLADAIAYVGRVKKVGRSSLEDFMGVEDPRSQGYISQLFSNAQLRRDYFMLSSSPDFRASESYKLQQVMDRALGRVSQNQMTKLEESFTDVQEIFKFLQRISEKPSSIRRQGVAGATLNELVDGIMTVEDFHRLVGKKKNTVGTFADQDFGYLRLTNVGRSVNGGYQKMYDDIIEMSTASEVDMFENDIRYAQGIMSDLSTVYQARAKGLETRYMTSSGDVVLPRLSIPGGGSNAAQVISGQKYKRLSTLIEDGTIQKLMDRPYIKGSAIGVASFAAFGLIYSAMKDRTPEDMQGPPLLPGGSAYETAYPGNSLNLPIPEYLLGSSGNGVTYKVNASGSSENARRFGEAARGVSSGSSSINYYDNIRNISTDPYKQMGESY
jgi:hypothetical protein